MPSEMTNRAVAFARTSGRTQDERLSPRGAGSVMSSYCKKKGLTIVKSFYTLNSVIVTAAVGMQQQGNIQGLGIQHQLADDLRPNDLTQFENLPEERGVHNHFDPATLRDRLAIYPQDAGTRPDPDQHNPCRTVTWSSTPP